MLAAWATLALALLFTALAWHLARRSAEEDARQRFDFRIAEIKFAVHSRMQAQVQVLRGAGGLFAASVEVGRSGWRDYVKALRLESAYPGIQGLGFAQRILPGEMAGHLRKVRGEGFPDYSVRPPGERDEYTSIVYLEPFDWRNRRAFGYDMFAEPVRRAAMTAARDSGEVAISGKVKLEQETEHEVQPGFLIYLPVYRHGARTDTPAQRRAALRGYVYSPLRMHDLMEGVLGRPLPDLRLEIYDGGEIAPERLLYDSRLRPADEASATSASAGLIEAETSPRFASSQIVDIHDHPWTLRITSLPAFESSIPYDKAKLVVEGGLVISLLLFAVVMSQATLNRRAIALARQMTAALRESREQFRAVAETANDAIVSANAQGRIVYFNRAAEAIFGYAQTEVLDRSLTMLMPKRFRGLHLAGFRRFQAGGEPHVIGRTVELAALRKNGKEFPIEISVANWQTAQGQYFTAILRDIGERHRAEERIRQLNAELRSQVEQLAAVNQELESFSYSVSHDLRAPLRAVDGFAGMLEEDYGRVLDTEGARLLRIIRDNAHRMGLLIDDLLAFSRLGRAPVARTPVDMNALVQEVIEEIRTAGDAGRAEFAVAPLPASCGDRAMLRQVWTNLIANAVKFSRPRPQPRIEVGGRSEAGECLYHVRDNGVGYDMAHAGQLFSVFHRLHRNDEFPGTGVGLAIVARIVGRHGGRVWAEGQPDAGATFHFSLPDTGDDND